MSVLATSVSMLQLHHVIPLNTATWNSQ